MKTQLIQLDPADDVISVRDKMGWSQTSRILLVWPESGHILNRRLDLLLLQRHSARLGAQLALATQSPVIREIALELSLPVFANSRQAQNARWRGRRRAVQVPRREKPPQDVTSLRSQRATHKIGWQGHPIARYSLFCLSILAVLIMGVYFLPSVTLTLRPEVQIQTISLPVTASLQYSAVSLVGEIPAQLQRVVVEGRASQPTSGNMLIPGEPATGTVSFTNLTTQAVNIPKGQVVITLDASPVRFFTTRMGVVPAGPGRTVSLPVQALVPGETGNVPPGSVVAIEGELGLSLSANNSYTTRGGSDVPAPAPTDEDRRELLDQLTATLRESALADLQNSLAQGDLLILTTLELAETLEQSYVPTEGLPGDALELTLRLEYQVMVIQAETLQRLVIPLMDGSLPEGQKPLQDTLLLFHAEFSSPNKAGEVRWNLTAQRMLAAEIPQDKAVGIALGRTPAQAVSRLEASLPLADEPQVELFPAWWPRLPYFPMRIRVITE